MRLSRIVGPLALAASIATLSTACSSGAKAGVASAPGASSSASASAAAGNAVSFSQCMRDHGVNIADPVQGQGGGAMQTPGAGAPDPNSAAFKTAQKACQQYMPNGGTAPTPNAEELAAERKFAKCMRDHGVDIPDPNGDGQLAIGDSGSAGSQLNPNDPKFQAAQKACQSLLPNGGAPKPQGGSGS